MTSSEKRTAVQRSIADVIDYYNEQADLHSYAVAILLKELRSSTETIDQFHQDYGTLLNLLNEAWTRVEDAYLDVYCPES